MNKTQIYILDTNIISYWMRGNIKVIAKIQKHAPSALSLSTITLAEILYGIAKSPHKKKERRLKLQHITSQLQIYPFDETAAQRYAHIRSQLEKEGQVISERDTQIAAIALANQLTVVTHNVKEFDRITKLKVEDWAK